MTSAQLDELERLCNEASPGPWRARDEGLEIPPWLVADPSGNEIVANCWMVNTEEAAKNVAFIVRARTAMPELIAEVRRLKAKCGEVDEV